MKSFICCTLVLIAGTASAQAGDCCDGCGCDASCCKVCRMVPSTKKVTTPEYKCECEDFCVPGPSLRTVCRDECGHKKIIYTPTCAEVRTRKKLVKTEKTKTVPTTKWVVENLCPQCASGKSPGPAPSGGMANVRLAPPESGPLAAAVDPAEEKTSGGHFAARVKTDLARVLLPASAQK